jgi:hypothetical protein
MTFKELQSAPMPMEVSVTELNEMVSGIEWEPTKWQIAQYPADSRIRITEDPNTTHGRALLFSIL